MRSEVQAAVLLEPGMPLEMDTLLLDEPLEGEVRVRVERVGLCHSDLHYIRGSLPIRLPAVLGHEVAGIVETVGPQVHRVSPGDRVVATVTPSCGQCRTCLSGRPTQCLRVNGLRARDRPRMTTKAGEPVELLGAIGAFAQAMVVKEASLAVVPRRVPPHVACLLGCCITTGFGAAVHGAAVRPEDTVVVIGCGGVGIAAIQGARIAGARQVVAVDTTLQKLDLASRFGASHGVLADPGPGGTLAALRALRPDGFSHAIEAVGRPDTAELAFAALEPTGTATILGLMQPGQQLSISADELVYGDRRLQGAYMGANRFLSDVEMFTDHYEAGRLDIDAMVTTTLPFRNINEGLEAMAHPATVRVVLELSEFDQ